MAVDARHDRGTIRDDGIELARSREATLFPQHLVPAATDDPARVRIRRDVLADSRRRIVDARRVAQVDLDLLLAETGHVAVRIGKAGQHVLAAAVDDRRASARGLILVASEQTRDAPVLDDEAGERLHAVARRCVSLHVAQHDRVGPRRTDHSRRDEYRADPLKHALRSVVILEVPARLRTSSCACKGRSARRRTQMVRLRSAQSSVRSIRRSAIVFMLRTAVVSGTTPTPTLHSTSRHTASKLRSCTRNLSRRPVRSAFSERNRCSELVRSSPTKSQSSASAKANAPRCGELVTGRCDEHEPVDAEREYFQAGHVLGAGDDADIRLPVGDSRDDLVAQTLLEIDVDLRVRGEELAERLRQEFGERIGVRHQPDVAFQAVRVLAQLAAHALGLLQQQACVMNERAAGRRRLHALPIAIQQRGAELDLHIADPRARGCHGQVHALGAGGDAAGFHDVQEELEIREVEAHA